MSLRPLHDRLLLRRLGRAEESVGGIYIPDIAREKSQMFEVLAAGQGRWASSLELSKASRAAIEALTGTLTTLNVDVEPKRIPLDVKAGDRVLLGKYSGTDITVDGEQLVIVREDEVLAVIKKRPAKWKSKSRANADG